MTTEIDPDMCQRCGQAMNLGPVAHRGEIPSWCWNCNFERSDIRRRARVEPR